jgi:hypothetical protein
VALVPSMVTFQAMAESGSDVTGRHGSTCRTQQQNSDLLMPQYEVDDSYAC